MPNEIIQDGETTFLLGQDASKDAEEVRPGGYFAGVNVTAHNGSLGPRPGFAKRKLDFSLLTDLGVTQPNGIDIRDFETIFKSGRFQAIIPYVIGNTYYLLIVVSGIIYLIHQQTYQVSVIPIDDGSFIDESLYRVNSSPSGKQVIIYDYPNFSVIVEGFTARRADPFLDEIPIAVLGTYNENRLFIGNAGNEFTAGDPTGTGFPDAPLSFTEILTPASSFFGQVFQLPTEYNNEVITAMAFLQVADTSTGIGPLLIGTSRAIYSYATQLSRLDWELNQFGTLLNYNTGIAGPRALTNVNSDLFFMGTDGQIRSLSMARNSQAKWANVPLSREVRDWLKFWDKDLTKFATMSYFKNKIYITANPYRVKAYDSNGVSITDIAHGGMVVLSFDSVGNLSSESPPAWDGLYTGINPMDMTINNDRFFIMSKNRSLVNNLYELTPDTTLDIEDDATLYIRSILYTREFQFESPFNNKEAKNIELSLENIKGDFNLVVEYKPSHACCFLPWKEFTHIAPWRTCKIPTNEEVKGFCGHQFRELNLGSPSNALDCNPVSNEIYSVFRTMQLKFTIEARYWELHAFVIRARLMSQNDIEAVCSDYPVLTLPECCNTDWFTKSINLCQKTQT